MQLICTRRLTGSLWTPEVVTCRRVKTWITPLQDGCNAEKCGEMRRDREQLHICPLNPWGNAGHALGDVFVPNILVYGVQESRPWRIGSQ